MDRSAKPSPSAPQATPSDAGAAVPVRPTGVLGSARFDGVRAERRDAAAQISRSLKVWRFAAGAVNTEENNHKREAAGGAEAAAGAEGGDAKGAAADAPDDADGAADASSAGSAPGDGGAQAEDGGEGGAEAAQGGAEAAEGGAEAAEGGAEAAEGGAEAAEAAEGGAEEAPPVAAKLKVFRTPSGAGGPPVSSGMLARFVASVKGLFGKADAVAAAKNSPDPPPESLDATVPMGNFIQAAQAIFDAWTPTSGTAASRITSLGAAANAALSGAGVPPLTVLPANDAGEGGKFDAPAWSMLILESMFQTKPAEAERLKGVATTVYHEARHAEQFFTMARMLAGKGKSKAEIASQLGNMKADKIDAAIAAKMAPTDPKIAKYEQMLACLNDPATDQLMRDLKRVKPPLVAAQQAWQQAKDTNDPSEPAKNAAAAAAFQVARPYLMAYMRLDHEADAYQIEAQVARLWP